MKRNIVWSLIFTFGFIFLHVVLVKEFNFWLCISVVLSFCLYFLFSVFLSSLYLYKRGFVWAGFLSILSALPILNFFYYQNYGAFIPSQLISALLKEPVFLLATLKMQLLPYVGWIVLSAIGVAWGSGCLLRGLFVGRNITARPFFLFRKIFIILPFFFFFFIQVRWCIKYDMHQLLIRSVYIWGSLCVLSFLFFLFKTRFSKMQMIAGICMGCLMFLGGSFVNGFFKNKTELLGFDQQFIFQVADSLLSPSRDKSLKQSEEAAQKYKQYRPPHIPFNVLVILNDAQRARNMGVYGYERYPDRALIPFYQKAYAFKALSPANFTDTSVPAMFTGQGPQRHPSYIKDSLTLWDYFPKYFFTFYILTAGKTWARLDEFFNSFNMQHLWSASDDAGQKDALDYIEDRIAVSHLLDVVSNNKHFVGVFHANSMHFPYYQKEGFAPYQPCETERKNWPQTSVNCYDNAIYYLSSLEADLLQRMDLTQTIVIITSDHGEGFYEHGSYFHNQDLHEESIRVPFIWYIPSSLRRQIPQQYWENFVQNQNRYVSTSDLVPTLLHLASILTKEEPVFEENDFTGRSLFKNQKNRIVVSSGCFVDYRCYSRDVVFADENYFVLLRPGSLQQVEIYSAQDFQQQHPLKAEAIEKEKIINMQVNAPFVHPLGGMLKNMLSSQQK